MKRGLIVAIAGLALSGIAPALAQSDVLTGQAAFGGWQESKPGVRRHITPQDLPPPYESQSASNAAAVVRRPEGVVPELPPGYKAELVASGLRNPRAIRFAPNGDLFVADSMADRVLVFRFQNGAARPAEEKVFATRGLSQPYGIAFYPPGKDPQWVYVANSNGLVRFPYQSGDLQAGGAEQILSDIPANHHWTRDIAFSPDGRTLYYSVGSGSNVAEGMSDTPPDGLDKWVAEQPLGATWGSERIRADVLAMDPDGKNVRIFATGLRNCSGLTIQPATGQPWCVVNERDGLGNNIPFDYATHVAEGAFYGWPWYYIGSNEDPRHKGARPGLDGKVTVPDVLFQAHSAPLNIAFDATGVIGNKGDAFVAMHGSWNRSQRTGYKVVRLTFDGGRATGVYEDFMTGFVLPDGRVWGRPVGVAFGPDGALYVSEDGNGTIWKVSKQ